MDIETPGDHLPVDLFPPLPNKLLAGQETTFRVRARNLARSNVEHRLQIHVPGENARNEKLLWNPEIGLHETGNVALSAPSQVGEHTLRIVFPEVQSGQEEFLFSFETVAHTVRAVGWGVPSLLRKGERAKVMVGLKCDAGCNLSGSEVRLLDAAGRLVSQGRLGPSPWPGSSALYWTEMEIAAGDEPGRVSWSLACQPKHALPLEIESADISSFVSPDPEHEVSVCVEEAEENTQVAEARVRIGRYRGRTDPSGRALVDVPAGSYRLTAEKPGYKPVRKAITVERDLSVTVALEPAPDEDPADMWTM